MEININCKVILIWKVALSMTIVFKTIVYKCYKYLIYLNKDMRNKNVYLFTFFLSFYMI